MEDFYAPLQEFSLGSFGDLRGSRVLELGCGPGATAVMLAKNGCLVEAIDRSKVKVATTWRMAKDQGVGAQLKAQTMDVEALSYPDSCFDIVFSRSVLMYVDPDKVAQETARVLRPGGRAVYLDNLRWHPFIFLYRRLVSKDYGERVRHLSLKSLETIGRHFRAFRHREYYLISPLSLAWLKLFGSERRFRRSLARWSRVDDFLLRRLPFLRRFAWMTAIVCEK